MHVNGVGHSRDEKITGYTILVVPWAEIYVLEAFKSSKIYCPGDKNTLYNVCSVHRGMFSTSGGVQYIGGIP